MKHISILVLEGATIASLDGTYQLFSRVNDFLRHKGRSEFYKVDLVATTRQIALNNGIYKVNATKTIDEVKQTDLIIIPIICGDFIELIRKNKGFVDWINTKYREGSEVASLCVGAFFLASTGILNGKSCATHWAVQNEFQNMFPMVKVVDEQIITDENRIYTSGGNYSYLNLILYIIEKHLGREISLIAAKMFEVDIERKSQGQFAIFTGQKNHNNEKVLAAQNFIEKNSFRKITVDELCTEFSVHRRTFERIFKKATKNTISEYIQRVKVEAVKKQLETEQKTISEIIFDVGYNDINAFRNIFKKYVGMSPSEYKRKFSRLTF